MILKPVSFLLLLIFFNACERNPKADAKLQVLTLKEMSDLATVEYTVTKIIKANDNKAWFKLGERKILISCRATLTAGIDLSKISDKDINADGKTIELILPHAKLISLDIKPEDVKTEYEDVTIFRSAFSSAEKDALVVQGEASIRKSIETLGILQTAEINATLVLSNFLRSLGYEKISIRYNRWPVNPLQ